MNGIADTGLIVAFGNRADRHHGWALNVVSMLEPPFLTCEAVLAEAAFHLASSAYVVDLVRDGMLSLAFDLKENLDRIGELAARYRDRKPDLADLCVLRMSELFPRHVVVTVDEADFRIYRRRGRDVIPLLCPPSGPKRHRGGQVS